MTEVLKADRVRVRFATMGALRARFEGVNDPFIDAVMEVCMENLKPGIEDMIKYGAERIVIAYEPVWCASETLLRRVPPRRTPPRPQPRARRTRLLTPSWTCSQVHWHWRHCLAGAGAGDAQKDPRVPRQRGER